MVHVCSSVVLQRGSGGCPYCKIIVLQLAFMVACICHSGWSPRSVVNVCAFLVRIAGFTLERQRNGLAM